MINRESVINTVFSLVYNGIKCEDDSSQEVIKRACTAIIQRVNGFYSESEFINYVKQTYPDSPVRPGPKIYNVANMRKGLSGVDFSRSALSWISSKDPLDDAKFFSQKLGIHKCLWIKYPEFDKRMDNSDLTFDKLEAFIMLKGNWVKTNMDSIPFFHKLKNHQLLNYFSTFDSNGMAEKSCKYRLEKLSDEDLYDAYWDVVASEWFLKTTYYLGSFIDIDFVSNRGDQFVLYEVKQKYPSANNLYGIDLWKVEIYRHIGNLCETSYYYIIRETNRQHVFKKWMYITFSSLFSQKQVIKDGKPGSRFIQETMKSIMVNRLFFKRM